MDTGLYFDAADYNLFVKIILNSAHVRQPLIPDHPPSSYDLRPRTRDKLLLDKATYLNDREFVIRLLLQRQLLIDYCICQWTVS